MSGDLARVGGFALFVLWLTVFPMSGPLLGEQGRMAWFIWPHVLALLVCARFAKAASLRVAAVAGIVLTALVTLAWGLFATVAATPLLVLLGIESAPPLVRLLMGLGDGSRPVVLAAAGLALGNLGALGLELLPLTDLVKLALLAGAWPGLLLVPSSAKEAAPMPTPGLSRYLVFVFLFQIVSGLMYEKLWPAYNETAWLPGIELAFYALAAVAAAAVITRDPWLAPLLAIVAALLAFASRLVFVPGAAEHTAMFGMMTASGILDLFLVATVLSYENRSRAAGYGMAASAAGVACGQSMAAWLGAAGMLVSFLALVVLNVAVIALLLRRPDAGRLAKEFEDASNDLPEAFERVLSNKEKQVLHAMRRYDTYREVAEALAISESSVKTYMKRIFQKTGVFSKRQLLERLRQEPPHPEMPPEARPRSP